MRGAAVCSSSLPPSPAILLVLFFLTPISTIVCFFPLFDSLRLLLSALLFTNTLLGAITISDDDDDEEDEDEDEFGGGDDGTFACPIF